jgi:hypothetical protein
MGHALQQDPGFAAALQMCGRPPVVLPGEPRSQVWCRRVLGLRVALLSRAALTLPGLPELFDRLASAGLGHSPLIVTPEHRVALGHLGALPLMTPGWIARLDLTRPADMRRAALHPKWRNQLRKAMSGGPRWDHRAMPPDLHHPLIRAEAAQRRARGYGNWPLPVTLAFAQCVPQQTRLFTAYHKGRAVAYMLFFLHGTSASYHIGHITPEGRSLCAHNLLLWQGANWLAGQGIETLDLGLLDSVRTPGLVRFKLRSGAQARALGGTWLLWPPLARRLLRQKTAV